MIVDTLPHKTLIIVSVEWFDSESHCEWSTFCTAVALLLSELAYNINLLAPLRDTVKVSCNFDNRDN